MKNKDSINERRRQRIRKKRRKELEQEIENEIPGSEFTPTIERRLAEHRDPVATPPLVTGGFQAPKCKACMAMLPYGAKDDDDPCPACGEEDPYETPSVLTGDPAPDVKWSIGWRVRCAIRLARFTLWLEKCWKKVWKKRGGS